MEATVRPETEQTKKSLDLYIYDVVTDYEYDIDNDEFKVAEASSKHVREMLTQNEDVENINIFINSAGGSIYEGLAIYNQLKRSKAYKTVHIDGFACSISSVIAMAGDKIIMPKASMMMIHNAWTVAVGNAKELRKIADDLDIMSDTIANAYLEKSGGKTDEKKIRQLMNVETYLPAEKCLELGLCDKIAESGESAAEKAVAEYRQTASMLTRIKAETALEDNAELTEHISEAEEPVTEEPAENISEETSVTEPEVTEDPKDSTPLDTFMNLFTRKAV